jgi:hypothetical protein
MADITISAVAAVASGKGRTGTADITVAPLPATAGGRVDTTVVSVIVLAPVAVASRSRLPTVRSPSHPPGRTSPPTAARSPSAAAETTSSQVRHRHRQRPPRQQRTASTTRRTSRRPYAPNVLPMRQIRVRALTTASDLRPLPRLHRGMAARDRRHSTTPRSTSTAPTRSRGSRTSRSPSRYSTRTPPANGSSTSSPTGPGRPPLLGAHGRRRPVVVAEIDEPDGEIDVLDASAGRPTPSSATCTSTAPASSRSATAGRSSRRSRPRRRTFGDDIAVVRAAVHGARAVVRDQHREPRDRQRCPTGTRPRTKT